MNNYFVYMGMGEVLRILIIPHSDSSFNYL